MFKLIITFCMCLFLSACTTHAPKPNPTAAKLNTDLGLAYLQQGNVEQAKNKMLRALRENPNDPLVLESMGYFLEQTGDRKRAEQYYLQAIKLAPKNGAVQNDYGIYLCRQGKYQNAIKYFVLAAENINYLHVASAYENAGLCALKIPDKQLAKKYLQKALRNDPDRASVKNELTKLN